MHAQCVIRLNHCDTPVSITASLGTSSPDCPLDDDGPEMDFTAT